MKWSTNILVNEVPNYTSKGMVIGRPKAVGGHTVDDMERMGLVGVYDPEPQLVEVQVSNPFLSIDLNDLNRIVKAIEAEPKSTLDDRIKEVQQASPANNPAKYRARWTGTGYTYDRITPK